MEQTRLSRPETGLLQTLRHLLARYLASPVLLCLSFLLAVFLTHLPTPAIDMSTDDYLQRAMLAGSPALEAAGLSHARPDEPFMGRINDAFHFFNSEKGTLQSQRDFGNLPWWGVTDAIMQPWRPLVALTHWLDYTRWPSDTAIQWHNLLYFMLFAVAGLVLYRTLSPDWRLVLLAAALLVFDFSVSRNFAWYAARNSYLACAFGMLSIACYLRWREEGRPGFGVLSWGLFGAALLTAEAGLATAGYLGAYALVADRRGWWRGLAALLPFMLLVVVWRFWYSSMGYGATGVGLYVDPGRDLGVFAVRLLETFPLIGFALATGLDGVVTIFDNRWQDAVRLLAWGLVAYFLWVIRHELRVSRMARFLLLGALFAAVPHATLLSVGSRSSTFVAIGCFFLCALVIRRWLQSARRSSRVGGWALLTIHLFLPVLLLCVVSWNLVPVIKHDDNAYPLVAPGQPAIQERSVVYLNHPATHLLYYYPYVWDQQQKPLPRHIQAMAPGLSAMTITRTGERSFLLVSKPGFVTHQEARLQPEDGREPPVISEYHSWRMVGGLLTSPDDDFAATRVREAGGMTVTILESRRNQPTRLRVEFTDSEPMRDKLWKMFDWREQRFVDIDLPDIGESLHLPGALDTSLATK